MKKTLILSVLFVFTMAMAAPVMANSFDQEPVKTEKKAEDKKKKECTEKKACCSEKKACSEKKEKKG